MVTLFAGYSAFAQNFISFVDGRVLQVDNFKMSEDKVSYMIERNEFEFSVKEIAFVLSQNGEIFYLNYNKEEKTVFSPQYNSANPVSSILKGMSVFVKYKYDELKPRLCAYYTMEYLKNDNTFNLVYTPIEAHFIFEVNFDERGSDRISFIIRNKDTNDAIYSSKRIKTISSFNPHWETKGSVENLMNKEFSQFTKLTVSRHTE